MTIVAIDGGKGAMLASSTARDLRDLADKVESGAADQVVCISVVEGGYRLETNASAHETIALAAILHDWAISRARA